MTRRELDSKVESMHGAYSVALVEPGASVLPKGSDDSEEQHQDAERCSEGAEIKQEKIPRHLGDSD